MRAQNGKSTKTVSIAQKKSFVTATVSFRICLMCENTDHAIYNCPRFVSLSPRARQHEAKRHALCVRCLKKGHQLRQCKSGSCCSSQSTHHTLLHYTTSPKFSVHTSGQDTVTPSSCNGARRHAFFATSLALPLAFSTQSASDAVRAAASQKSFCKRCFRHWGFPLIYRRTLCR